MIILERIFSFFFILFTQCNEVKCYENISNRQDCLNIASHTDLTLTNNLIFINKELTITYGTFIYIIAALIILFSIVLYIVSKKKVEKRLPFIEQNQLRTLIDNLPDFIYIKDEQSKFIVANKRLASVLGLKSTDELIGKTDLDFYPKDLANKFYKDEQDIINSKVPLINHIEKGLNEKGENIYVSTTKIPLKDEKDNVIGIVGIGRDITKMKEYEEQLIQQTKMLNETNVLLEERQQYIEEQAEELKTQKEELAETNTQLLDLNASKDKLFSIIAHDLRNPFNTIMGFSELLALKYDRVGDDKKKNLIGLIYESTKNVHMLLENLLQWSKTQTNSISYKPQNVNLSDIVNLSFKLLETTANRKGLKLIKNLNNDLFIYADKNMVLAILRNLISNAIKFTSSGEVVISARKQSQFIEISIEDTGIGMPDEVLKSLFKLHNSETRNGTNGEQGSGLGLIICKEFVEKNGGKINVTSAQGKGTTFKFNLPMTDSSVKVSEKVNFD